MGTTPALPDFNIFLKNTLDGFFERSMTTHGPTLFLHFWWSMPTAVNPCDFKDFDNLHVQANNSRAQGEFLAPIRTHTVTYVCRTLHIIWLPPGFPQLFQLPPPVHLAPADHLLAGDLLTWGTWKLHDLSSSTSYRYAALCRNYLHLGTNPCCPHNICSPCPSLAAIPKAPSAS